MIEFKIEREAELSQAAKQYPDWLTCLLDSYKLARERKLRQQNETAPSSSATESSSSNGGNYLSIQLYLYEATYI
jgi:hypothetical protein